jgi:hypothetical protein
LTYVGTRVAPKPGANAAAKMKRLRRVNGTIEMIRRPLVATEANRKVVMPPSTAEGIATRAAANLLKTPMRMSQKQAANPAFRLAHRVKAVFCQLYIFSTSSRISITNHPVILREYRHRSNGIVSTWCARRGWKVDGKKKMEKKGKSEKLESDRSEGTQDDSKKATYVKVQRPAMSPFNPSARTPPWMRLLNVSPST